MEQRREDSKHSLEELIKEFEYGSIVGDRKKPYRCIRDAMDRHIIGTALRKAFGNQLKAARILGINRNTLRSKIKKLDIDVERWKI